MTAEWRRVARLHWAMVDSAIEPLLEEARDGLLDEVDGAGSAVVILLPRQGAPPLIARDEAPAHSFLCDESTRDWLLANDPGAAAEDLCYHLLSAILNGALSVARLLIRQLPLHEPDRCDESVSTALLMAHRGRLDHLRTALNYLPAQGLNIRVGLDVDDPEPYRALAAGMSHVEFFHVQPAPAGPYVIRQRLAERSHEAAFLFHDSDDVSCSDRLWRMGREMRSAGGGLVGCHELVVDEILHEVRPVRYPLDVSAALRDGPHYAFLHGTSMIARDAFFYAGGFSTDRAISYDTQFLFRAWFHMPMRNADCFLYIRRKHAESLTVRAATAIGSDARRAIERPWGPDFEAVKAGTLELRSSTLMPVRDNAAYDLVRFA